MIEDLFISPLSDTLLPGYESVFMLKGYAEPWIDELHQGICEISKQSPFRRMTLKNGNKMTVEMTNCGEFGWLSDQSGYRYTHYDPLTAAPWPDMPSGFKDLAIAAASEVGFNSFVPDSCLVNRYHRSTGISLHQDINEIDFGQPIVSVSLGVSARFILGGLKRCQKQVKTLIHHADVMVWGGVDRKVFHGVMPLQVVQEHSRFGATRINLTFRKSN